MSYKLKVEYVWTEDELKLQGLHYEPKIKDVAVVLIHGMSGNFIDNEFGDELGKTLAAKGIGFIFGHNRGWGHINDLAKKTPKLDGTAEFSRNGAVFEKFSNCHFDIDAWVSKAKELGYKRLVLMGHSLGCNKLIYSWEKINVEEIIGVGLLSPADMVGLVAKPDGQPNYLELCKEAKEKVRSGKYSQILSSLIWDWYLISAQTFLEVFTQGGPADVFPLLRNPSTWEKFAKIAVPIFCLLGENDDVVIRSISEDLKLIESKAVSCPDFQMAIIAGANHGYENREKELAREVLKWISKIS